MNTEAERWKERAKYDLDTAEAMFSSRRYQYVLFCCQQAVEKMLKSIIADRTSSLPPRVHQLMRLAEVASIKVPDERAGFLRELSVYYIESRYPEEQSQITGQVGQEMAKEVLRQTEETIQWLESIP